MIGYKFEIPLHDNQLNICLGQFCGTPEIIGISWGHLSASFVEFRNITWWFVFQTFQKLPASTRTTSTTRNVWRYLAKTIVSKIHTLFSHRLWFKKVQTSNLLSFDILQVISDKKDRCCFEMKAESLRAYSALRQTARNLKNNRKKKPRNSQ